MASDIICNIVFVVIIVLVLCLFLYKEILNFIIRHSNTETQKCKKCKGVMVDVESFLYLIPVYFGNAHEESADYYIHNAKLIMDDSQIPSGNRACHLYVFQCQNCGYKNISIIDFLKVRDQEVVKGGDIYPYEKFKYFIENSIEGEE